MPLFKNKPPQKIAELCRHEHTRIVPTSEDSVHYCYHRCLHCGRHVSWARQTFNFSVDLDINYELKEYAKQHGACWDPSHHTWFLPCIYNVAQDNPLIDNIRDIDQVLKHIQRVQSSDYTSEVTHNEYYQDNYFQSAYYRDSY